MSNKGGYTKKREFAKRTLAIVLLIAILAGSAVYLFAMFGDNF